MSKYTKLAIQQAFLKLLNEQPFDKIKVKDIVEECQCNRNTFYYYYQDIYALLEEMLDDEMSKAMQTLRDSQATYEDWQEMMINSTQFVLENRRAAYHLYNSINRKQLEDYIFGIACQIMEVFVDRESEGIDVDPDDKKMIVSFYVHAIVGIFEEWMDGHMKQDMEWIIRRLGHLLEGNIREVCEMSAKEQQSERNAAVRKEMRQSVKEHGAS